ncbi:alpha/beta hydrolase [Jiulongibacter sediminis]|uniref:1,4-beta-xylanase n=1 Tax=Jiulongibacter sediminis TaxID=1605367 RepID=A0A0P7BSQ6_9BACT|nr:alpha/beta hydrolase [Jiulongibacter sediminis]KPM47496.1 1,4-beta-xylanase [Jiulongibacter sediminis]TBX23289.1 1,4-beta-xylanase [Jiulongibacter sediminis]
MLRKLFLTLLFISPMANAQKVIPLYPDGVPGLKDNHGLSEANVSDRDDGVIRLRNITNPTLTVFEPKASKKSGAAVIICPGGGYYILAFNKEGTDVAKWYAERGITAFVLKYRLPQEELFIEKSIRPLQDAQQAFRYIRSHADQYKIDKNKVGIMGFSAGGHLAATASTHYDEQVGEITDEKMSVKPDFSVLMYPVVSFNDKFGHSGSRQNLIGPDLTIKDIELYSNELHVSGDTPPAFLVHAFDDPVKVENSLAYVQAMKKNGVSAEFHMYAEGGHGFGLAVNKTGPVSSWPHRLEEWLKTRGLMK